MGKSKSLISRREFLKVGTQAGALLSSTLFFSGCTSLEKAFSGEKKYLDDEVVILGAGAAGLAAAYTLKKNKVPFRIFDASSRIGGRVYTLQAFAGENSCAELGAEFFDESHRRVFQLCKELGLEVQELKKDKKLEDVVYFVNGKVWTASELRKHLKPLYTILARHNSELFSNREIVLTTQNMAQFEKSFYYDSLSAEDFINSLRTDVDAWILEIFSLHVRVRFGVELNALSALQLLQSLNREPTLHFLHDRAQYRLTSGMGQLTQALYERVAGVIPDYVVKVEAPLTRIRLKGGEFKMDFEMKEGRKMYSARQVICTLPFSTLRDVEGLRDLPLAENKRNLIFSQMYATQSKAVIEFTEAFWKKRSPSLAAFSGDLTGSFLSQNFSNSTQDKGVPLLSVLRGGVTGASANDQMLSEAIQDLEKIKPGVASLLGSHQNYMNWSKRVWSKGSRSSFAPGQFSKYSGVAEQPECNGQLLFAGEHTSIEYPGTVEGAVGSGIRAAEAIIKKIKEPAVV